MAESIMYTNVNVRIDASRDANEMCAAFVRSIVERMDELGVSRTELARRLNVSRPYVSKVLGRDINLSFGTASKFATALGLDFHPVLRPAKCAGNQVGQLCQSPENDIMFVN